MTREEIDVAVSWAAREGWNPGRSDAAAFHAADPEGFLASVDEDGSLVASISAVRHGDGLGFIGFYIVVPERRGEGHGIALWRAGMERLAGRVIGLDGVVAQQGNYARSGFALARNNARYGTDAVRAVTVGEGAAPIVGADTVGFDALVAYDCAHAGEPRPAFLREWLSLPGHVALAAVRSGSVAGLGVVRSAREGAKIGPLFADDVATARALFTELAAAPRSGPLFLDVPAPNEAAIDLAREAGMEPGFLTARMYAGPAPTIPVERVFGVTTFELG
jgi:hypothetical protein